MIYHITYTDHQGNRQTGRVTISRDPFVSAAKHRERAVKAAQFKYGARRSTISAVRVGS